MKFLFPTIHGRSRTSEHNIWLQMKQRCTNPRHANFAGYGGRGISVCKRWAESFGAFLEDMGERPSEGHSIDRIDNDGNYEPGNCRWATQSEQCKNTRRNRYLEHDGRRLLISEWCAELGLRHCVVLGRLRRGDSDSQALRAVIPTKRWPRSVR